MHHPKSAQTFFLEAFYGNLVFDEEYIE